MTEPIAQQPPCVHGCTYPAHEAGAEPTPRPATHGPLCGRCFYRLTTALEQAPALIASMRSKLAKTGAQRYGGAKITGSKSDGSPAPLALDPLHHADDLYARLATWVRAFAVEFSAIRPRSVNWDDDDTDNDQDVRGMHVVDPASAYFLTAALVDWLLKAIDRITASAHVFAFYDDVCMGFDEEHQGVYALMGRYGVEPPRPRPPASHECPLCGNPDIFVKWPDKLNPDLEVLCARCRHVVDPDRVNRHAWKAGLLEQLKADAEIPLTPVGRRCTGSVDCTADEHHEDCFSLKPQKHGPRRDDRGRPVENHNPKENTR